MESRKSVARRIEHFKKGTGFQEEVRDLSVHRFSTIIIIKEAINVGEGCLRAIPHF